MSVIHTVIMDSDTSVAPETIYLGAETVAEDPN